MTAAEKLKETVDGRGIKYTFLAGKTGIPLDRLSKVLSGKLRLRADELIALCVELDMDIKDFV